MTADETQDGITQDAITQDDPDDARNGVGVPRLDVPLASTLTFDALSKRPSGKQIAQVQRYAAGGRYGRGWRRVVESRTVAPWPMALAAGGVIGVIFLIAVVVAALQGDGESALVGLAATAVVTVVVGGLAYAGAAAARRRRWRRHARVAAFAEANGLQLRLSVNTDAVPRAVRYRSGRIVRQPVHADVMSARVGGLLLMTGTRSTDVRRGESTSTFHQVWAGLRFEVQPDHPGVSDSSPSRVEPYRAELQTWCAHQQRRDPVELMIRDGWLVLATEGTRDDLSVLETLVAGLDLALVLTEVAAPGPEEVPGAPA